MPTSSSERTIVDNPGMASGDDAEAEAAATLAEGIPMTSEAHASCVDSEQPASHAHFLRLRSPGDAGSSPGHPRLEYRSRLQDYCPQIKGSQTEYREELAVPSSLASSFSRSATVSWAEVYCLQGLEGQGLQTLQMLPASPFLLHSA